MNQFMVEIKIVGEPDVEFFRLIPEQRATINELMEQDKIVSYSLDATRTMLWCIVNAESEDSVYEMISHFPLIEYMVPHVFLLMFHNSIILSIPKFSVN